MLAGPALIIIIASFAFVSGDAPDPRVVHLMMRTLNTQGIAGWLYEKIMETISSLTNLSNADIFTCMTSMGLYIQHLGKGDMWALKMFDSTSKLQSGLLQGNFQNPGQYDECVNTVADFSNFSFSGMHCLVDVKITLPKNMTIEIDGSKQPISTLLGSNVLTLTLGQCFPSTCKAWVLNAAYGKVTDGVNHFLKDYNIDVVINPSDCHLLERGEFTVTEWMVVIVVLLFVFLASLCTTIDIFSISKNQRNRRITKAETLVLSFSVSSNWKKLTSTKASEDSMTVINGLKFISICWVVLGHRYRYLLTTPITNLTDIPNAIKDWTKMLIISAPLSVDTFFMISGLLNMYGFCFVREKRRAYNVIDIIKSYIHRFVRLTPAYAMMIAITATWLYRTGNGPFWDRVINEERNNCATNWWLNLVYLNNYIHTENYCMMQSWYLAADMQMFWVSPLLLYPLWRWPWIGYIEVIILTAASIASPFSVSYFDEIKTPLPVSTNTTISSLEMKELYFPTHTKTISYVIGILTGYILYQFKNDKLKFRMNTILSIVGWLVSAAFMLYAIFGGYYLFQFSHEYNKMESAFYIGFFRFFWSVGLAWLIINCVMGYGGPINVMLSWKPYGPLGRLTYCIYLTHIAVILHGIGSTRLPAYYMDFTQVTGFFGDLIITIACAIVLTLLLEAPIMGLEKILLGGGRKRQERRPNSEIAEVAGPSDI